MGFNLGIEVDYPINVDKHISPGKVKIRCMLLLWTGDYPAQCQVGKFLCKGTFGCRVDKCKGKDFFRLIMLIPALHIPENIYICLCSSVHCISKIIKFI